MARGEAEGHIRFEDAKRGSICCIYTDYYTIYDIFSTSDVFTVLSAILLAIRMRITRICIVLTVCSRAW